MSKLHLGVLGSGAGSNMQSIVDAIEAGTLDAEIKLVLADVADAKILDRAKKHNIPCQYLDCAPWKTKLEGPAEDRCIRLLKDAGVDMSTPEPVEKAMRLFESVLDRFEALYE